MPEGEIIYASPTTPKNRPGLSVVVLVTLGGALLLGGCFFTTLLTFFFMFASSEIFERHELETFQIWVYALIATSFAGGAVSIGLALRRLWRLG